MVITAPLAAGSPAGRPSSPAPGRRERQRAATEREIKDAARRLLVSEGIAAVSLRAIAREVGVTAPALYRYYDGHEGLISALVGDLYDELCDAIESTVHGSVEAVLAAERAAGRAEPAADLVVALRLVTASRAFRSWSVAHRSEFGLVFGAPIPGVDLMADDGPACRGGLRFGQLFAELFLALWGVRPFPVPDETVIDERLLPQLAEYRATLGVDLPLPVVYTFLSCWARLYGMVTMEAFGHLSFALRDVEPAFETELASIGGELGLSSLLPELGRLGATTVGVPAST